MVDNFIFSANAVLPIFMVIGFGYVLRQKVFLTSQTINEMNRLVFSFALPVILFRSIYQADFSALFNPSLVVWMIISILVKFVLIWFFAEIYLRKHQTLIASFTQAAYRSNYAIMGLPLVANIMGGNDTGMAALSVTFIVVLYNALAVVAFTVKDSESGGLSFVLFKKVVVGVCQNPSIIGAACGIVINLLGITMPVIARESVNYIATLGTPLALLAVGGSMQISEVKKYIRPAVVCSVIKIAALPIIIMSISVWLGFRGEELAVLFAMSANPTAMISFVMAARMNGNAVFTSAVILITTAFSLFTITLGVYLMRVFALV